MKNQRCMTLPLGVEDDCLIRDAESHTVGHTYFQAGTKEGDRERAKFIVLACNNHDLLVKALGNLMDQVKSLDIKGASDVLYKILLETPHPEGDCYA